MHRRREIIFERRYFFPNRQNNPLLSRYTFTRQERGICLVCLVFSFIGFYYLSVPN